ncbi:hypothetical protein FQA39_LY16926 [Lamprigera yunnana]|nr:hypothetical protein FQA39_LY16926 [Lamprigera yunnana]
MQKLAMRIEIPEAINAETVETSQNEALMVNLNSSVQSSDNNPSPTPKPLTPAICRSCGVKPPQRPEALLYLKFQIGILLATINEQRFEIDPLKRYSNRLIEQIESDLNESVSLEESYKKELTTLTSHFQKAISALTIENDHITEVVLVSTTKKLQNKSSQTDKQSTNSVNIQTINKCTHDSDTNTEAKCTRNYATPFINMVSLEYSTCLSSQTTLRDHDEKILKNNTSFFEEIQDCKLNSANTKVLNDVCQFSAAAVLAEICLKPLIPFSSQNLLNSPMRVQVVDIHVPCNILEELLKGTCLEPHTLVPYKSSTNLDDPFISEIKCTRDKTASSMNVCLEHCTSGSDLDHQISVDNKSTNLDDLFVDEMEIVSMQPSCPHWNKGLSRKDVICYMRSTCPNKKDLLEPEEQLKHRIETSLNESEKM